MSINQSDYKGVRILSVPYDDGRRGHGMGAGALYLLENGLDTALRRRHPEVNIDVHEIRPVGSVTNGWDAIIAVNLSLREAIVETRAGGKLPLVLGGGCLVSLGAVAGLGSTPDLGVLWFDAHGDLNTPETSPSGCLEGMPLALLLGRFGGEIWKQLSDQPALSPENVILAAARDLDPGEISLIGEIDLTLLSVELLEGENAEAELISVASPWAERCDGCYLHIDVDALDVSSAPAVSFPSPGGLSLTRMIELLSGELPLPQIECISLTAVFPQADRSPTTAQTAIEILDTLLTRVLVEP